MQCVIRRACACRTARVRSGVRASGSRAGTESPLKRLVRDATSFGEAAPAERELQWATQPYAARASQPDQEARVRPEETSVLLFPGEGSEFVGMGRRLQEVPAARELYELASSIVGWDVGRVCREGPAAELARRAQPALLVTALGALEAAREARPSTVQRARAAAGYGLGEITALVFAAALPFDQALRLVELRATAMQAAATERAGGMLEVRLAADARLGELMARAREAAAERGVVAPVCQVAAYLHPACKLLAGDEEALQYVESAGRALGVVRCARVRGAGAMHSPLMARAQDAVREALRLVDVSAPALCVLSCLDGRPYARGGGAGEVRRRVERLTTAPARWEQTLHALFARPRGHAQPLALALGPHGTTRAVLRQVNARAWDTCVYIDV